MAVERHKIWRLDSGKHASYYACEHYIHTDDEMSMTRVRLNREDNHGRDRQRDEDEPEQLLDMFPVHRELDEQSGDTQAIMIANR